jgi:hypothetical protein
MALEGNHSLVQEDLKAIKIKYQIVMTPIPFYCLFFLTGCFINNHNLPFSDNSDTTNKHQRAIEQSNSLTLVYKIPIRKGSLLENTREDNWEFPKDFIVHNDSLYILSSEEKKIIGYSKISNEFFRYTEIEKVLENEKYNDVSISPIYLQTISDFIIVGYDYRILIFSKVNQNFLYRIVANKSINKITVSNSELFVWFDNFVEIYRLQTKGYKNTLRIPYPENEISFSDIVISFTENIATQTSYYSFVENILLKEDIKLFPYNTFPDYNKESFTLNCITSKFLVWYPWSIDSTLILINKESGETHTINIGFQLSKNNLFYEEDRENGLKMISDEKYIYFLIMNYENNCKILKVYQLDLFSSDF